MQVLPIQWRTGPSGDSVGFVGPGAVFQILPKPFHSPPKWNIFDQRAKLIGSAGSLAEAKAWCETHNSARAISLRAEQLKAPFPQAKAPE
jgi:hypothetical protein